MSLLVVAAVEEELGPLGGEVLGVGPLVAAVRAANLLAQRRPEWVLLVGTAGAYPGGPAIGTVVAASRVGWSSGVEVIGAGYVPRPPEPIAADERLSAALGLPRCAVLTTAAITTDPPLAATYGRSWAVEHLEAYGVALACREAGIAFAAVLGVANEVGPDAHAQWLRNRAACEGAARRVVAGLLARGQFLAPRAG